MSDRLDRSKRPPPYPAPGTSPQDAARRRFGRASTEARRFQRSPLTRTNFSLYTWHGRVYMAVMAVGAMILLGGLAAGVAETPPGRWDGWLPVIAVPVFVLSLGSFVVLSYRHERRVWRLAHNRCPACGYDLTASPGRCPECGQTS